MNTWENEEESGTGIDMMCRWTRRVITAENALVSRVAKVETFISCVYVIGVGFTEEGCNHPSICVCVCV